MSAYGIYSPTIRDFLTYSGRVLVHSNRAEMEWLFPGARIREVPPSIPDDQRFPLAHHPQLGGTTFPLRREEFRA
jgi:hypothetical protein